MKWKRILAGLTALMMPVFLFGCTAEKEGKLLRRNTGGQSFAGCCRGRKYRRYGRPGKEWRDADVTAGR